MESYTLTSLTTINFLLKGLLGSLLDFKYFSGFQNSNRIFSIGSFWKCAEFSLFQSSLVRVSLFFAVFPVSNGPITFEFWIFKILVFYLIRFLRKFWGPYFYCAQLTSSDTWKSWKLKNTFDDRHTDTPTHLLYHLLKHQHVKGFCFFRKLDSPRIFEINFLWLMKW